MQIEKKAERKRGEVMVMINTANIQDISNTLNWCRTAIYYFRQFCVSVCVRVLSAPVFINHKQNLPEKPHVPDAFVMQMNRNMYCIYIINSLFLTLTLSLFLSFSLLLWIFVCVVSFAHTSTLTAGSGFNREQICSRVCVCICVGVMAVYDIGVWSTDCLFLVYWPHA